MTLSTRTPSAVLASGHGRVLSALAVAVALLSPPAASAMDCSPYGGEGLRQYGFSSCDPLSCEPEVAVFLCDCYGDCTATSDDPASLLPYGAKGCCEYLPCAPGYACEPGQPGCDNGICKITNTFENPGGLSTFCGGSDGACFGPDPTWLGAYTAACFTPDETCDGEDNDCDGNIDNVPDSTTPLQQACYSGPPGTLGVGACKDGIASCVNGQWGACAGDVPPSPEACDGRDNDCDRQADESLQGCNDNEAKSCQQVGGATQFGDPTSVGGATFYEGEDARISGSLETFRFKRSFASDPGTWRFGGSFTPDELFVPRPFGANDATGASLAWSHELYSFVHVLGWDTGASWNLRMPGGAFVSFTACSNATGTTECFASPSSESRELQYRLHWDGTGVFTLFTGDRRYRYEAQDLRLDPDPETRPGTRYFLSAVEDAPEMAPSGLPRRLLELSYAAPNNCSSLEHVAAPYLESVTTADGAQLRFLYDELPSRIPARIECVLRAVHIVDDASSLPPATHPLVEYTYTQEAGVETAGFLASAHFPAAALQGAVTETYEYKVGAQDAFVVRVNGLLKSEHLLDVSGRTTQTSAEGEAFTLSYGQSASCDNSVACCSAASVTVVEDSARTAGDGLGSPSVVRAEHKLERTTFSSGPRVAAVTVTCTAGQCSGFQGGTTRYAWTCDASDAPPKQLGVQDTRGNWTAFAYSTPGVSQPTNGVKLADELRTEFVGAVDSQGTGALESVSYTYAYAGAGQTPRAYEPRIHTEERASLLGPTGAKARLTRLYDSASDRLLGEIRSGYTRVRNPATNGWVLQERHVGTFLFTSRVCSGGTQADALGRVLEVHGPCFVGSDQATDCPGTSFPVTQLTYYDASAAPALANRPRYVDAYPDAGASCLGRTALRTEIRAYDVLGNPTEVVDANGVLTEATYGQYGMTSRTVANATTQYRYLDGRLASVRQPSGGYEVFCYRAGTPAGAGCTGGSPTRLLQWKARSAYEDGRTWSEKVVYEYWPSDALKKASYQAECSGSTCGLLDGELRHVERFAEDAGGRPAWRQWGEGPGSFSAVDTFDSEDNLTGIGPSFNGAPAWCGGFQPDGTPLSKLCSHLRYDRANRLERSTRYATLSSTGQHTLFTYDAHGNTAGVKEGCGAGDDFASCAQPAAQYQHDDFGNLVEARLPPMQGPIHFDYDAWGKLVLKETPSARAAQEHLSLSRDGLGRLTLAENVTLSGRQVLQRLGHDDVGTPPGNCTGLSPSQARTWGRLRYRQDSFGYTWYRYDAEGRVLEERRVRNASAGCDGQPHNNPSTLYTYTPDGHLASLQYPYGRQVHYDHGTGASAHRVHRVRVTLHDGTGWVPQEVLSQVVWEPYGGLRGYRMHHLASGTVGSVEYLLGDDASQAPSGCPAQAPAVTSGDLTGRTRALWVSSLPAAGSYTPGAGNGSVLKQVYTWQGNQLVRADSCLLGAASPRTESYTYDGLLRVTAATGTLSTQGGAFQSRGYGYDGRGNRTSESTEANTWGLGHSTAGQPDWLLSRNATAALSTLGATYQYDADGRVSRKTWRAPTSAAGTPFELVFTSGPAPSGASESVFRAVSVNGLTFNYFYDGQGRRRLKDYPTGIKDEYFYDLGHGLLVDQGSAGPYSGTSYPTDEYVWLDSRPVAVIRGKLDASWAHLSDGTANCMRMGEASACGLRHLVTDYLGKPVLMLDGQGRVAGTGEYDVFGHVNRVQVDVETPHPYQGFSGAFGGVMRQPTPSGTTVRQRFLFDSLGLWSDNVCGQFSEERMDDVRILDAASNAILAFVGAGDSGRVWTSWATPGASGAQATLSNHGLGTCTPLFDCSGIHCVPSGCNCESTPTKPEPGAAISAYEYQRYQTGAQPFWTPLRFPGQYHDAETDLFENWNRYYDPGIGRYLQPEPRAVSPAFIQAQHLSGHGVPFYAYARNNPLRFVDPDGLKPKVTLNMQEAIEVSRTPNGKPGATMIDAEWEFEPCEPCDDGTYEFKATIKVTIRTEILEGQRDESSADEPGLTLIQHEENHRKDLETSSEKFRQIKTDGFKSLNECRRTTKSFEKKVNEILNEADRETRKRDKPDPPKPPSRKRKK